MGPNRSSRKFRIVRFVDSKMRPVVGWTVSSVRPSADMVRRVNIVNRDGDCMNIVFDGCNKPVSGSNLEPNDMNKRYA